MCLDIYVVEVMWKEILFSDVFLIIVLIVVLMNIVLLLIFYLEVKENIVEIVMMGGLLVRGNINISVEFNMYVDLYVV